ncbi:BnaC03g74130D [Brassica napus]|uniref:BnaC03g74130D protein n=1 Tax=Brassica napus TaxID=3708 RepID=A0A078J5I0_BRANA|nr:BnaC03g74130D [Brassica napus]
MRHVRRNCFPSGDIGGNNDNGNGSGGDNDEADALSDAIEEFSMVSKEVVRIKDILLELSVRNCFMRISGETEQEGTRENHPISSMLRMVKEKLHDVIGLDLSHPPSILFFFTEPVYHEWGFWRRFGYQYMAGFTARWKCYFIWSISEASIIISGLGFSGWTDENTQTKAKWDLAKNVDILVSTWLRHYVYERIVKHGKKAGFFQLLATQTVSAVWHGLYPGYIICFVQSALMIDGSKAKYNSYDNYSTQKHDDARQFMKFLLPDLGIKLCERSYVLISISMCLITQHTKLLRKIVYGILIPFYYFLNKDDTVIDTFFLAYITGWWRKQIGSGINHFRQTSITAEDGESSVFLMKLELSYERCLKGLKPVFLAVYIKRGIDISRRSGEPRRDIGNMMKSGECCSTGELRFERVGGCKIKLGKCKTRF